MVKTQVTLEFLEHLLENLIMCKRELPCYSDRQKLNKDISKTKYYIKKARGENQ